MVDAVVAPADLEDGVAVSEPESPAIESVEVVAVAVEPVSAEVSPDNAPKTKRHSSTSVVPKRSSEENARSSQSFLEANQSRMASCHFITMLSVRRVPSESQPG